MKATETTIPAWQMAIKNRPIERTLIFHSDRGVQYACHAFTKLLKKQPLVLQSMSGKGNCRVGGPMGQCRSRKLF